MIDIDKYPVALAVIRSRWQLVVRFLDERGRRLFAANESLALGLGGVTATARATGLARSTINRGIQELRSAGNESAGACVAPVAAAKARWPISPICPRRWKP